MIRQRAQVRKHRLCSYAAPDASAQKRWQTLKHIDGQLDVNSDRKSTQPVIGTVMADRDGHLTVTP
jgi:hypothetical protein